MTGRDATASAATTGGCPRPSTPASNGPFGVGRDGYRLLEAVYAPDAPAELAGVETVQVLRATWTQQLDRDGSQVRWRDKQTGLPPGSRMILNPYDLHARPGA